MSMTDSLGTLERMVRESGDAALAQDWQEIRHWFEIPEAHTANLGQPAEPAVCSDCNEDIRTVDDGALCGSCAHEAVKKAVVEASR